MPSADDQLGAFRRRLVLDLVLDLGIPVGGARASAVAVFGPVRQDGINDHYTP